MDFTSLTEESSKRCPCLEDVAAAASGDHSFMERHLADTDETIDAPLWHTIVVAVTIFVMFVFMITDKIGPDWVMVAGLTFFMLCNILSVSDGLEGFSNEGILTVMVLFVVAEGVSRTGALDYYMGLIMGKPKTTAGAQIRIMVPIAILSAFLNNTPIVAVMIPLTIRWAKSIGVHKQQLLIPLSYATILGGTCTLVGTSTNLVVSGLLEQNYPGTELANMGLFDLAVYGIPNALIGLSYMLMFAPFLLPQGGNTTSSEVDDLLLGARVTPWSPAANRTVMRSGLGNSGGIYLVNVRRAATGNVHHAVSKDFVISVGDELYFTATVEEFGAFCKKHGLEIITTENITSAEYASSEDGTDPSPASLTTKIAHATLDETEQIRLVHHLSDQIGGREPVETGAGPAKVILANDSSDLAILVGVNCQDRSGLLLDISSILFEHGLKLRHSEAKVFADRSLSVWRCESLDPSKSIDLDELWTALDTMLRSSSSYTEAVTANKHSGTRVVRATVTSASSLIGKKPILVNFRTKYKAAIVAYQKQGKNSGMSEEFAAGDPLVLETSEDSPLLRQPPEDFYSKMERLSSRRASAPEAATGSSAEEADEETDLGSHLVWRDLKVVFDEQGGGSSGSRDVPKGEFLTAFVVAPQSPLENKSLNELGYSKLPGVVLVSIERPIGSGSDLIQSPTKDVVMENKNEGRFTPLSADDPLRVGDVFWFSGCAEAIGDLRKIHGLVFYQEDEMKKAASSLHERRLVQAVVARGSPLIGKTVKDVHFRSQYGGAVIAIQRGSERVHEHPGYVKLQTGDVLLVEAGPSFVEKHANNYRTFALLGEVENSSPPRPRLFLLCVVMIVSSLIVAALEYRSLLVTAATVAIIMVSLGVVTQQEARDAIQWDLYMVVSAAFGIGTAMKNSGVAKGLATFLVSVGKWVGIGDAGLFGSIYLATCLLSSVLTNNAAAALMYPIAMNVVDQTGVDRLKMAYMLMLGASDYMTSFGYQTNLMVYGPGGYRNIDFTKFGAPMQTLLWLSSTALVSSSGKNWYVSWLICSVGFVFIALIRLTNGAILKRKNSKEQSAQKNGPENGVSGSNAWQFDDASRKPVAS